MLGVMTSLQQPITGKVSTSLAGIQPIMNKLLKDISNSNTINPSDLIVSTASSSSSASSSSDVVKVELNTSPAASFGMNSGMSSGMNSTASSGVSSVMNTAMMTSGISPGTVSGGSSTSTYSGPPSRLAVNMNPGMSSGMNLPGMNQTMHSGMSSGMNVGMGSNVKPGMSSSMNIGMGTGMNSAMGSTMNNPGLGMPPMGMNSSNQLAPMPSGSLTGMQQQSPDVYSTLAGVGGATGPQMINQNPQAQQMQVPALLIFNLLFSIRYVV